MHKSSHQKSFNASFPYPHFCFNTAQSVRLIWDKRGIQHSDYNITSNQHFSWDTRNHPRNTVKSYSTLSAYYYIIFSQLIWNSIAWTAPMFNMDQSVAALHLSLVKSFSHLYNSSWLCWFTKTTSADVMHPLHARQSFSVILAFSYFGCLKIIFMYKAVNMICIFWVRLL